MTTKRTPQQRDARLANEKDDSMDKPGTQVAIFEDVDAADRATLIEVRLVLADDGSETLWHYENGEHVLTDRAARCLDCGDVIAARAGGGSCFRCINTGDDL